MKFRERVLDNGLRIISEWNPLAHSMAIGFFVRTGSRDETTVISGVSHFLEHMAFKGNEKYQADDVNRILDEIGAKSNASTSEEITKYWAAILPEYLPQAFELVAGLITPSLRQDDFDMEKNVILEEIAMYEDLPSFTLYDKMMQAHFAGHPLGQSILGTPESIADLTSEQMREYHRDHYVAGNVTLAIAGNFDWEEVNRLADQCCGWWPAGEVDRSTFEAQPEPGTLVFPKDDSHQQYCMQMSPAPPANSPLRFAAEVLAVIVGDDSGSRMYWDLVEPGDVEVAELGHYEYDGSGSYATYVSARPEAVELALARISDIYDAVNSEGVTEEELERAKKKAASRIVLRSERPMSRLSLLGGNWIYRGTYRSVEDDLNTLQSITLKDVRELLDAYPLGQMTTVAVGPLNSLDGPVGVPG